jgi:hypothetical protein
MGRDVRSISMRGAVTQRHDTSRPIVVGAATLTPTVGIEDGRAAKGAKFDAA